MSGRIDLYPTEEIAGWQVRPGRVVPYGATVVPGGVNFSIFSGVATGISLVLFEKDTRKQMAELPLPDSYRIGDVWAVTVFGLDPETFEYGFRVTGSVAEGGARCDAEAVLLDPRARAISGRDVWGTPPDWSDPFHYRGFVVPDDFDWRGDKSPEIASEDLVIYEMHVRGFTPPRLLGRPSPRHLRGGDGKNPPSESLGNQLRRAVARVRVRRV